jgi:hypothetical protein
MFHIINVYASYTVFLLSSIDVSHIFVQILFRIVFSTKDFQIIIVHDFFFTILHISVNYCERYFALVCEHKAVVRSLSLIVYVARKIFSHIFWEQIASFISFIRLSMYWVTTGDLVVVSLLF